MIKVYYLFGLNIEDLIYSIVYKKLKDEWGVNDIMTYGKRSNVLDLIKGIAIILVVLGHSIQYGSGSEFYISKAYFENWAFQLIYSFHMPLFMLLSGYLFYYTIKKYDTRTLMTLRFTKVILPIFVWSFILVCIELIQILQLNENITLLQFIKNYIQVATYNVWFLWAIFYSSMIVIVVNKLFKDRIIVYLIIGFVMLFIPDVYNANLYKYMYPYFVIAYLFNKYQMGEKIECFSKRLIVGTSIAIVILYLGLFSFYGHDAFIYTTGITLLNKNMGMQFFIDIYRWVIGLLGSSCVIGIVVIGAKREFKITVINKILESIGKSSIGIYIISTMFINENILLPLTGSSKMSVILLCIETVIVLVVCYVSFIIIKHFKWSNKILFGGR